MIDQVLALLAPGAVVLIGGPPGSGKTTLCRAVLARRPETVLVTIPPDAPPRSTAANRAARVAAALAAAAAGYPVILDACAATPRTRAYWTRRIPDLRVVRLVVPELERRRRLAARRQQETL